MLPKPFSQFLTLIYAGYEQYLKQLITQTFNDSITSFP